MSSSWKLFNFFRKETPKPKFGPIFVLLLARKKFCPLFSLILYIALPEHYSQRDFRKFFHALIITGLNSLLHKAAPENVKQTEMY